MIMAKEIQIISYEANCGNCNKPLESTDGSFLLDADEIRSYPTETRKGIKCGHCRVVNRLPKAIEDLL